jgi:hypothetical protein
MWWRARAMIPPVTWILVVFMNLLAGMSRDDVGSIQAVKLTVNDRSGPLLRSDG